MQLKIKNALKYINKLFLILVIFTFLKMIYFTITVNSEMVDPIKGSEFVLNKRILSYMFCSFSVYTLALIFNGKKSFNILFGLNVFLSVFMFINLIYFRSFESYLSIYNIAQYKNFGVVGTSALALIRVRDILLFIDPIFLWFTRKYWIKEAEERTPLSVRQRIIMSIVPLTCAGLAFNYDEFFTPTITKVEAGAKLSIVGHHFYDLSSFVSDSTHKLTKDSIHPSVDRWFKNKNAMQGTTKYDGIYKDQNVLFIQVESLENFAINLKVEGQEVTPTLNSLLKDSFYFNNVIAQENGGNSSDADFMVNTSLIPLKSGSVGHRFPDNKYNSLPVILRGEGYNSHVIHSGEGYFWNKENFLPNYGFDSYTDIKGMDAKEDEMFFMGLKDKEHFSQVADKVATLPNKHYLFTVTETSHTPFELPDEMKYLKLSEEMDETIFGKYFQSIRYTDDAIKELLEKLDKNGNLDNTVVVFYGDHEGIHKYNNDDVLKKQTDDYQKYANAGEVPFIVYKKNSNIGQVVSKTGGQIDIMPTVLGLLGVEKEKYVNTVMGASLLDGKPGYAIDRNGKVFGTYANEEEYKNIKKSINISEKIIRANYFSDYYKKSRDFKFNNESR